MTSCTWEASSRVGTRTSALRAARARLHRVDDEREAEGQRLARSGRRLAADVPAREGGGDRLRLNREGFGDALAGEAVAVRRGDAKV